MTIFERFQSSAWLDGGGGGGGGGDGTRVVVLGRKPQLMAWTLQATMVELTLGEVI